MRDKVMSRRVAVSTLNGQMEQLLKQSSSELTAEQTDDHKAIKDDVQHKLNTVSVALLFTLFILLIYVKHLLTFSHESCGLPYLLIMSLRDRSRIHSFHLTDLRETFAHFLKRVMWSVILSSNKMSFYVDWCNHYPEVGK